MEQRHLHQFAASQSLAHQSKLGRVPGCGRHCASQDCLFSKLVLNTPTNPGMCARLQPVRGAD